MTALAVLVALVGAMFVAMASAQTTPSAPKGLEATGTEAEDGTAPGVDLEWEAPTLADGVAVADYDVQYRARGVKGGSDWRDDPNDAAGDTTASRSLTVADLNSDLDSQADVSDSSLHGETLEFRVRYMTDATDAPESRWSAPVSARAGQMEDQGTCMDGTELELDLPGTSEPDTDAETCALSYTLRTGESVLADVDGDYVKVTSDAAGMYTVTANKAGTATVTVTGSAGGVKVGDEFEITVVAAKGATAPAAAPDFSIKSIKFDDTDSVVSAGTPVMVTVTVENAWTETMVRLSVPTTGLSISTGTVDDPQSTQVQTKAVDSDGEAMFTLSTVGAPAGDYTVTVIADRDGSFAAPKTDQRSATKDLSVGTPGDAIGEATLSLGVREGEDTPQDSTDDTAESGSDVATGEINLNLAITNSRGKPANNGDIQEILVVAPRATVRYADATGAKLGDLQDLETNNRIPADDSVSNMLLEIKSVQSTPRVLDVYVIVLGSASSESSATISLTFTGPLDALKSGSAPGNVLGYTVGDDDEDKGADARDRITFTVDATDKSGNALVTPTLSAKITDPDGKTVHGDKYEISQSGALDNKVHLDINVEPTSPLKAGPYKVTFSRGATKTDPVPFTVVGTADSIETMASNMAPDQVGSTITVTATVMSGDDAVADGTMIVFTSPDVTGDDDAVLVATTSKSPGTKAGKATVTYAVVGAGTAIVTATVSDDTSPEVDIAVIKSTAGAVAVEEKPEEASLSCLSETNGFTAWTCGVESSASEIFGWITSRGATAIHLWNDTSWVRYSVVDGAMVPGSSDFTVAKNDILYISN